MLYQASFKFEEQYKESLKGLLNLTFKQLQKAATTYGLSKSSLAH
jgi:hypothetical protein